jgi:hypothetical protein
MLFSLPSCYKQLVTTSLYPCTEEEAKKARRDMHSIIYPHTLFLPIKLLEKFLPKKYNYIRKIGEGIFCESGFNIKYKFLFDKIKL